MNSITSANEIITVPFHGQDLFLVNYNGEPYTPMKPISENMGLNWKSQYTKIKQRFESTVVEITIVAQDGKERLMTCLPVRKLAGWLDSISPNKVKPELSGKVKMYQEECDDVLWCYWNNKLKTNADQRTPLRRACDGLAVGNMLVSDAYRIVCNNYGVEHIDQIPETYLPEAVAYVYELVLKLKTKDVQDYQNSLRLLGQSKVEDINHAVKVAEKHLSSLDYAIKSLDCALTVMKERNATNGSVFEGLKAGEVPRLR